MIISFTDVCVSAAGGALGAALGALLAFSMMGAVVLMTAAVAAATGSSVLVTGVALGPALGPHVTFAGGVAGAAFAARLGVQESGRDIVRPLIGHNRPLILVVGAACGVAGMLIAQGVTSLATVDHGDGELVITDALAVSVVATAVLAHLLFTRRAEKAEDRNSLVWLPYQRDALQVAVVGIGASVVAGGIYLAWPQDSRSLVPVVLYGLSALSLIGFQSGQSVPVTHHITLPAALFAAHAATSGTGDTGVLIMAVAGGIGAAIAAELWARFVLQRVRTHLDPPAFAIAVAASVLAFVQWFS